MINWNEKEILKRQFSFEDRHASDEYLMDLINVECLFEKIYVRKSFENFGYSKIQNTYVKYSINRYFLEIQNCFENIA